MMAQKKDNFDKTSSKRQTGYLERLFESGGKPIRVDTSGQDIQLIDELIEAGYAESRVETYRKAIREAYKRKFKKKVP